MTTCGVGNWSGPLPGDPSDAFGLAAVPDFGGVLVSWSVPASNPFAVAYVEVFRGATTVFPSALMVGTSSGNSYFDRVTSGIGYYYWIRVVSINGTQGTLVGPVYSLVRSKIQDLLEELTGQINESSLAGSLTTTLGRITLTEAALNGEIASRLSDNAAYQILLDQLDADVQGGLAAISEEITTRTSADSALAAQITSYASIVTDPETGLAATRSALLTGYYTKAATDSAIAGAIETYDAAGGGAAATVQNAIRASVGYGALASDSTTPFDGDGTTIVYPIATYPTATYPEYALNRYRIIDDLGVDLWNATAAGIATPAVWVNGLPMASAVGSFGVSDANGSYSTLEQAFTTQKTLNDGFKGQYTVKLDVNGMVSGFGIYSDAVGSSAIFNVDKFAIGKVGSTTIYPFIVEGGSVKISKAYIQTLDANQINTNGLIVRDAAGNALISAGSWTGNVTGTLDGTAAATVKSNAATALSTANSASAAVASKMDSAAINVLQGNGGIKIGTVSWTPYVWTFSGSGIALSEYGLVGVQNGNTKFVIDYTGNAIFYGELSAAYGTFGALTVSASGNIKGGKTSYADTTSGFWLGMDSGTPKFHIGNSTAYLRWTGTELQIAKATSTGTQSIAPGVWSSHVNTSPGVHYAGGGLESNGTLLARSAGGAFGSTGTNWSIPTTAGIGTGQYVKFTKVSEYNVGAGGLTYTGTFNTLLQLNTAQTITISKDLTFGGANAGAVVRYEIYSDSSGTKCVGQGHITMDLEYSL